MFWSRSVLLAFLLSLELSDVSGDLQYRIRARKQQTSSRYPSKTSMKRMEAEKSRELDDLLVYRECVRKDEKGHTRSPSKVSKAKKASKGKGGSSGKGMRTRRGLATKGQGRPCRIPDEEFEDWEIAEPEIYTGEDTPRLPEESDDSDDEDSPSNKGVNKTRDPDFPTSTLELEETEESPSNKGKNKAPSHPVTADSNHTFFNLTNATFAQQDVPGEPDDGERESSLTNEDYKSLSNDKDQENED